MLFEAIDFINFLRGRVLGPMALVAEGHKPNGVRKVEQCLPAFAEQLKATVPTYDKKSCLTAMRAAVEIYLSLRALHAGLTLRTSAEQAARDYLDSIK